MMQKIETVLILVALGSLWPLIVGYNSWWYRGWLVVVLGVMVWVAARRMARIRAASDEAKRIRDETDKGRRRPFLR